MRAIYSIVPQLSFSQRTRDGYIRRCRKCKPSRRATRYLVQQDQLAQVFARRWSLAFAGINGSFIVFPTTLFATCMPDENRLISGDLE